MVRLIRRYANRRLYDTEAKTTIKLKDVARLINQGVELQVVDNKTGDDITLLTLAQVLSMEVKRWPKLKRSTKKFIARGGEETVVFIRKMLLASIGAFSMTKERAEEIVDDLIKRGEMSKSERAKFIRELMDKAEARSRELREKIDEHVEKATAKVRGSTSEDMSRLEEKIDALAQEVAELKKSLSDKK